MRVMSCAPLTGPASRLFAFSCIFLILYWVYGRAYFLRDPGSVFYDPEHAFDRFYVSTRMREAEDLFTRTLNLSSLDDHIESARRPDGPCLCATVVTVQRNTTETYLQYTIGSILANLTLAERASLTLNVFFADIDPSRNEAYTNERVNGLVDNSFSYDSLNTTQHKLGEISDMLLQGRTKDKSIHDYATALEACLDRTACPYVAVFEGDVVFADSWLAQTLDSLQSLSSESTPDWLDLRLFNQEPSTGWASKKIGGNKEFIISFGIVTGVLLASATLRRLHLPIQHVLTNKMLLVLCSFTIPTLVILFFQTGKASLLPPRPGIVFQFFGCCSQALVFNRKHIPGLISFLREQTGSATQYDMLTRDYAWSNNLQRVAQYPVLVQHIGTHSSQNANISTVWSMAFEQLNTKRLARSHLDLFHKIWSGERRTASYYESQLPQS